VLLLLLLCPHDGFARRAQRQQWRAIAGAYLDVAGDHILTCACFDRIASQSTMSSISWVDGHSQAELDPMYVKQ